MNLNSQCHKFLLSLVLGFFASSSSLAFSGSVEFTEDEVKAHVEKIQALTEAAGKCLEDTLRFHEEFYDKWGVSPFFGDQSVYGKMKYEDRKKYLVSIGKPAELVSEINPISCVGMAYRCLRKGFEAVGQQSTWNKIFQYTQANGSDGTALQAALQKLGWKIYLWNPDPSRNAKWDEDERQSDPTNSYRYWGYHEYNYLTATGSRHRYGYNKVDDWTTFVDFGTRPPKMLKDVPFFVGTAHGGYHVFPGTLGDVIESHSMRKITDPDTVESSEFNPMARRGGPQGGYRSGLLALPPVVSQ